MPMFPIIALVFTLLGIAFCAFAPLSGIGQTEAVALTLFTLLYSQIWKPAETRMGDVIEALVQGLYLTTFFVLLKLASAQGIADLFLPFLGGASFTLGSVFFALTRPKPYGSLKDLSTVLGVVAAMVAFGAFWHVWTDAPLHIAVTWSLLAAVFISMPRSAMRFDSIRAQSRGRFAVAEVTNRMIFAIGLSFLTAGTDQAYQVSLATLSIMMLVFSAFRIWGWQPEFGQCD